MLRLFLAALPRFALFLLALIPVLTGIVVLTSMREGTLNTLTTPADLVRRASYPWALTGHIIGGSAMLILGLAQFSPRLRRACPACHRWTGRVLILLGVYFALSALLMNFSDRAMASSALHNGAQNLVSVLFLTVLGLGVAAIRRGNLARHRVWMVRAYALTLGAATQTVMLLPVFLIGGDVDGLVPDLAFISAWLINLGLAEVLIHRMPYKRPLRLMHSTIHPDQITAADACVQPGRMRDSVVGTAQAD